MRRRSAIESIIGHMKSDGLLGRNYLKGSIGDKVNALLCGVGHDLLVILRKLRLFWLQILLGLYEYFANKYADFSSNSRADLKIEVLFAKPQAISLCKMVYWPIKIFFAICTLK
jgi:hypothetical protein